MNPTSELPLGLGMALAQNPEAMKRFTAMTSAQQQVVIAKTHAVNSKQEMKALVSEIAL